MQTSFRLSMLLLGPLFYTQGFYVRRVMPKLPEANGSREGTEGQGTPLSLLILGDSAAAGVGVERQQQALAGTMVNQLSKDYNVNWKLIATSGHTSSQLIEQLQNHEAERFDSVVISVGVNDVNAMISSKRWLANLATLTELLQNKFHAQHILFSSLPPMHRFPALPQPLRWWLGERAKHFNRLLAQFTNNRAGCTFGEIPYTPAKDLIAADGFHPGAKAYALWGRFAAEQVSEQH